ncbi:MAG: flavin reductase family protein [Kiritimatiellia bacterium]
MSKVNEDTYKSVIGRFVTGVTVIATGWGERLHAMTANAVTSVSLEPLRLLVCMTNGSHCLAAIKREGCFSVNILREDQIGLSVYFSGYWKGPSTPPFRFSPWEGGARLHGSIASVGCGVSDLVASGDHQIVIGDVQALYLGSGGHPLVYTQSRYHRLGEEIGPPKKF